MNNKGFTLIELIAVVALLALIAIITVPSVINYIGNGKQKTYDILVNNIVTASKQFFEECEYGGTISCNIESNTVTTTLGNLVLYGFLSGSSEEMTNNNPNNEITIINPKTNTDISECSIRIVKIVEISKTIYEIKNLTSNNDCPTTSDYSGV